MTILKNAILATGIVVAILTVLAAAIFGLYHWIEYTKTAFGGWAAALMGPLPILVLFWGMVFWAVTGINKSKGET